jgi:hypothetical protein
MRQSCFCFLAVGLLSVALGCSNEAAKPLPKPKDEATRRAAHRENTAEDFKQIAAYYKKYCAETAKPTSEDFWAYFEKQKEARVLAQLIMEQQYAIQVPRGGTGIVGYETDPDLDKTRVVVMADGTVNKTMPEAEFQEAMKKGKQ